MTDNDERIRIEIAFDGQQVLSVLVPIATAEDLDRALAGDHDGAYSLRGRRRPLHDLAAAGRLRQALGPREPGRLRLRRVAALR